MLELLQFRHSPYNEKVRWVLDLKRVPHARRSLLPGPHMGVMKKYTGQTATPALRLDDGTALHGSARIVDWLEQHYPPPRLIPEDPAERAEAKRLQGWFDDDLTPRLRRAVLDALLQEPHYFARVFGDGRPRLQQFLYSLVVPVAAPLIRKGNGIVDAAAVDDGIAAGFEALDFVVERSRATGYLVGDQFSLADIVAASMLAAVLHPRDSPMASPLPVGLATARLTARFAAHPGADWLRSIYARHRQANHDFDGARS